MPGVDPFEELRPTIKQNRDQYFKPVESPPPSKTFQIGFVLGGTVSVGSYTAGALDLFFQAVDAWYAKYENNPLHKILVSHIGGSSGGAVCATLAALASEREFPHVDTPNGPPAHAPQNPFWKLWVEHFDFSDFVETDDLDDDEDVPDDGPEPPFGAQQTVWSVLSPAGIDSGVDEILKYALSKENPRPRAWFPPILRVVITSANLRGIPYKVTKIPAIGTYTGNSYQEGDDFAWFAYPRELVANPADVAIGNKRPDEFWLSRDVPATASPMGPTVGYNVFADWARASGAVPVGLKARRLSRPAEHYLYRPKVRISGVSSNQNDGYFTARLGFQWPEPDWPEVKDENGHALDVVKRRYNFVGVDGGTFNNDPVKLVHQGLAGIVGRNPSSAADANRALFLIDPLVASPDPNRMNGESMVSVASQIIGAYTQESRYLTADLDMFADEDVFSRFQLVPSRSVTKINDATGFAETRPGQIDLVGSLALAGSDFFSVLGWCAKEFRTHDYLLGRHNMLQYLRKHFVLSASNPLFDAWFEPQLSPLLRTVAVDDEGHPFADATGANRAQYYLPIVPVDPADRSFNNAMAEPHWPVNKLDPRDVRSDIQPRVSQVLKKLAENNLGTAGALLGGAVAFLSSLLPAAKMDGFVKENLSQPLYDKQLFDNALSQDLRNAGLL